MVAAVKKSVTILIETSDEKTGFPDLALSHAGCASSALRRRTDYANDSYVLECGCGLSISLPKLGEAVQAFQRAAIDGQPHTLPRGSFTCDHADQIMVGRKT